MKIQIEVNAPRWTMKNMEDFVDWFDKEVMYRQAQVTKAVSNGRDFMALKNVFRKKVR